MPKLRRFLAAALLAAGLNSIAWGADVSRLPVSDIELIAPWPGGYVDMAVAEPRLFEAAAEPEASAVRSLAFFMSADLLAAPSEEQQATGVDNFVIEIPRKYEGMTLAAERFESLKPVVAEMVGRPDPTRPAAAALLNVAQLERLLSRGEGGPVRVSIVRSGSASVDGQQPGLVVSSVQARLGLKSAKRSNEIDVAVSAAACLLQGKLVKLARVQKVASPAEADQSRDEFKAWVAQVIANNN